MTFNDYGYIVDLSAVEAVHILDTYVYNIAATRGNGKSQLATNLMTAWYRIKKEILEGSSDT